MIKKTFVVTIGGERLQTSLQKFRHTQFVPHVVLSSSHGVSEISAEEFLRSPPSAQDIMHIKSIDKDAVLHIAVSKFNINVESIVRPQYYEVTDGHLGSLFGHVMVWKHILQQENGWYLICEDDWLVPSNLSTTLDKYVKYVKDADMIQLYHCDRLNKTDHVIHSYLDRQKTFGVANPMFGLQAYVITPACAKLLLDNLHSDNEEMLAWVVDDMTALSYSTADWTALLQQSHENEAEYLRLVHEHMTKFKTFPLKQIRTLAFRKNIGKTMQAESTTESAHFSLHRAAKRKLLESR